MGRRWANSLNTTTILFCAQHNYDPDFLWKSLPGIETVKRTEEEARTRTFTLQEATAWMRRGGKDNAEAPTAEIEAAALRRFVESWADGWG
jgi:hypothetical protein